MDKKIHSRFIEISSEFSKTLSEDILAIGPVDFPKHKRSSLSVFLARAVVGQQLSLKAARTIWGRIEEAIKESKGEMPGFFLEENTSLIRNCGLSGNKTRALISIREAHDAGALSNTKIRKMDHEARSKHLSAIRGIGPWTCDMASLFHFQEPDIWPEGDISVQKTFARYLGRRKPAKAAARFAPHRSYLAMYMWRIVDGGL